MNAFNQIIKSISDHDTAIDAARQEIVALVADPFISGGDAHEQAKQITKYVGVILSRLAQAREAKRILGLLEYEARKNTPNTESD